MKKKKNENLNDEKNFEKNDNYDKFDQIDKIDKRNKKEMIYTSLKIKIQ